MTRHSWCGACGKQIPTNLEITVQHPIRVDDQLKPLILWTWCDSCYHTAAEALTQVPKAEKDRSGLFEEEANDGHDGEETHEAMEREQAQIVVDKHGQLYKLHEDGKYQTLTVDKGNRHTLETLQLYFGPLTLPNGSPL